MERIAGNTKLEKESKFFNLILWDIYDTSGVFFMFFSVF